MPGRLCLPFRNSAISVATIPHLLHLYLPARTLHCVRSRLYVAGAANRNTLRYPFASAPVGCKVFGALGTSMVRESVMVSLNGIK